MDMVRSALDVQNGWFERSQAIEIALRALPAHLMKQRWYPAKEAGLPVVALKELISFQCGGVPAAVATWAATPPRERTLRLFLPLAVLSASEIEPLDHRVIARLSNEQVLVDAFASDSFVRSLVENMLRPTGQEGGLHFESSGEYAPLIETPASQWPISRSKAEQSNTSIRIGDAAMLKVIRRVLPGLHPELEMSRFLSKESRFDAVAKLFGWLDLQDSTIAILQAFIPNQGDGWNWVQGCLKNGNDGGEVLEWIKRLGERTAQMHLALAKPTGDAAFKPELTDRRDWQLAADELKEMAESALQLMKSNDLKLDSDAIQAGSEFERRFNEVERVTRQWAAAAPPWLKSRHHGDFHLGQVLVQGNDCIIVDFEGEPLRPLEERRAKHVPLKDVAGMLRSFAYVAASVQREFPDALRAAERAERSMQLETWVESASRLYLQSYFSAVPTPDERMARQIVRFFALEKALYEVLYEAANRPAWISIPLAGVLRLLDQFTAAGGSLDGVTRGHGMPYGAQIESQAGVRFRLWAPQCAEVRLSVEVPNAPARVKRMTAREDGWHEFLEAECGAGTRYRYLLPEGTQVPDPASRFQPEDVHGPSEVIDPAAYRWGDASWVGRPWHEAIIYELHVGTFTDAGTFSAAIEQLDHLAALGVTAIELMPIADFPGTRNWGYDGVLLYAPDSSYGRPEDLKAFIDAAHVRGLMVLLDVVYNHFGPDGNYLPLYAPGFFTERHKTPWGAAVNYDGSDAKPVREFIIHNALYWIEEYHVDGLRLDAVHAILDDGPTHLLEELAERVRASQLRPIHLLLENEENQSRWLARDPDGAASLYSAQWNDDLHHVLHVAATGEDQGYYADYLNSSDKLGRALAEGFAYQGELMAFSGRPRGTPSAALPPVAFVGFIQNHDQIGNRAFGERLPLIASLKAMRAIAAIYLLLPQVPMLFMGEEWGSRQPFPFFCDFHGDLAEKVRQGRREEFARFPEFKDESIRARIPDPQAISTFLSAKLNWAELQEPPHAAWLEFYRRLLEVRQRWIWPQLRKMEGHAGRYQILGRGAVRVSWKNLDGGGLVLQVNLSDAPLQSFSADSERVLWQEGEGNGANVGPWCVRWSMRAESPA
jgi:malto-oligosyltrehalose trehalohydrolase